MRQEQQFTVSRYIELLNENLAELKAKVVGEVSEMKTGPSGHLYFTIKDKDTGHILPCTMWRSSYAMSGVKLERGMEVLLGGAPQFYGPFGKFSFIARTMELVGEGALKKAYDELRKKLEHEGAFSPERKRKIPEFPRKIGVITSLKGAVIHDFSNNLGKFGYQVKMMDTRVEGQEAGRDLILSVRAFRKEDIDVLVLMRGGGSMQSLAGFDNELLVREILSFPVPVIAGLGHHQDVPLAALTADAAESTPSFVAALLNRSWEEAENKVEQAQSSIFESFEHSLEKAEEDIAKVLEGAKEAFEGIFREYERARGLLSKHLARTEYLIQREKERVREHSLSLLRTFQRRVSFVQSEVLRSLEHQVSANDPRRQLRLGYSLTRAKGKLVRSVRDVSEGEHMEVQVSDGTIASDITTIEESYDGETQ